VSLQLGGDLGVDLLHLRVGIGCIQVEEHRRDAAEHLPRALQGHQRVLEIRLGRVLGDLLDFRALLAHSLFESRAVVRIADPVERR